jgi:predicted Zn-dependent protease
MRIGLPVLGLVLLLPVLAACTTTQPLPDQRPGAEPALHTEEAGLWLQMERIEDTYASSGVRLKDPALEGYVREVVCRLSAEYCTDLRIYILQQPYFNARMWPNGVMEVWIGLLLRADNEAQLAFVLGHEMGHYIRRHSLQRMMEVRNQGNLLAIVNVALAGAGLGSAGYLTSAYVAANLMAFSRDNEREADAIGVRSSIEAGYDPREGAALWRLVKAEGEALDREQPSIFNATHPGLDERIANIEAGAAETGAADSELDLGRERYREATRDHRAGWLRAELRKHQFAGSQIVLDHLLAGDPNSGEVHFYQGELYRLTEEDGYDETAIAAYHKAIQLGGAPPAVHRELGLLYWDNEQFEEARQSLEAYLAADPQADDRLMIESYIIQLNEQVST